MPAEQPGCADQPGGVQVVTAGVHDSSGRRERFTGFLGDRQRVHITPQEDRRCARPAAPAKDADDRTAPLPKGDLQVGAGQRGQDRGLRLGQLQADLGTPMQFLAQLGQRTG
jgi:hypothetical protein